MRFSFTHTHTQSFYCFLDFVRDNPGESVPEETFAHSHLLWSPVIPSSTSSIYYDPRRPPCSIYVPDSLSPQSLKFSLVYLFAWHPPLILPTFLHPIIVYIAHAHTITFHNLFCCSTEIMSSNPSLSLNPLLGTLSCHTPI